MNVEEILDVLDEILDRAWNLPLTGGRCVVDAGKIRDLIDDIRLNMPTEIKQAKAVVADRNDIMGIARRESEEIIRKAEERARVLVSQEEIVKQAQKQASDIVAQAQLNAREMRQAAHEFSDSLLQQSEELMTKSLTELKTTRAALKNSSHPQQEKE